MVEQLHRYRLYLLMFALNLAVVIGVIYLLRRPEPRVITISTPAPQVTPTEALLKVQLHGAISRPGVYELSPGSRVSDALDAAGGPRPDADLDKINLALRLDDGDEIVVPARAEANGSPAAVTPGSVSPSTPSAPQAKININTATVEQLDALPRIGPTLAQRIVDYRTQNGPFKKIDDIKNVKGIGDALFDDMKALITVQ